MKNKIVLITGGAGGIGRATAVEVMRRGGTAVVADLPDKPPPAGALAIGVDLSSLAGVQSMVEQYLTHYRRLDALVNNVGVIEASRRETADGFEMTIALNYLSHFAATLLLLDVLKASAPSVILNVSSTHHRAGRIAFDDLQSERSYSMNRAYCQSKLANLLFTDELARRLAGTRVGVVAVHPGATRSNLGARLPGFWGFMWRASSPLRKPPAVAGQRIASLLSADDPGDYAGDYFVNGVRRQTSPQARDPAAARRLWDLSLKLAGLRGSLAA